jgi:1,2-dihydroxy-3-keto-5-methylthiopentene dioxygenase
MTILKVYNIDNPKEPVAVMDNFEIIAAQLGNLGIKMERWPAEKTVSEASTQEQILATYQAELNRLNLEQKFQSVDVINIYPDHPDKQALREKFLAEHIHDDDEVRFFIDGCGLFYIHLNDKVYSLLCEKGDLVNVPAGTKHWFDMGAEPFFKCIRVFTSNDGWVASFTGDKIANNFPLMGE